MTNDSDGAVEQPQHPEDEQLPCLTAEDAARLEQVFQVHGEALVRFLVGRLSCRQQAKDMAQETYVCMARGMTRERIENLSGFMFRIASNLVKNRYRERKQRGAASTDEPVKTEEGGTPEKLLLRQQRVAAVRKALAALRPELREVLLKYKNPFTHDELAEHLGISPRTVRRRLGRAHEEMRRMLRELGLGDSK